MNKLECVQDRVIVSVNMEEKNSHQFADGTKIRLERNWNNLDQKYTQPVNGVVISGDGIPEGAEMLISHNSTHPTNEIFNFKNLSGSEIASDIKYFSVPIGECFAWRKGEGEWHPMPNFDFALCVFEPYDGVLTGIQPTKLNDVLYVLTGKYKGNVVLTLKGCDYEIIYQEKTTGREGNIIRFRPDGNEKEQRDPEICAILHSETEKVKSGKLLVGLNTSDCKPLNSYIHDRWRPKQNDTRITA